MKKSLKILISIIIIIATLTICFNLYYNLKIKKDNLERAVSEENSLINYTSKEIDIDNQLIQNLYDYVLKSGSFETEKASFYKDNIVTYSSLSDAEKTLVVLKDYNDDEIETPTESEIKEKFSNIYCGDYSKNVKYKDVNQKSMKIFNQTYDNWQHFATFYGELVYNDNCYYTIYCEGGGLGSCEFGYSQIQNTELDNENIYIYDKYIYIDYLDYELSDDKTDSNIYCYNSSDKTISIGTIAPKTTENIFDKTFLESLYKKYENNLTTYKHTFKQNEYGTYYWYSTEPVK